MRDLAIGPKIADPGLCCRPRHVRVIPAQPRQTVALGVQTRRRIKIGPRNKNALRPLAREVEAHNRVDRLPVADMVFLDADQAAAAPVDDAVGIAQGGGARGRRRRSVPRIVTSLCARAIDKSENLAFR